LPGFRRQRMRLRVVLYCIRRCRRPQFDSTVGSRQRLYVKSVWIRADRYQAPPMDAHPRLM
jgi:hypothetical protein